MCGTETRQSSGGFMLRKVHFMNKYGSTCVYVPFIFAIMPNITFSRIEISPHPFSTNLLGKN